MGLFQIILISVLGIGAGALAFVAIKSVAAPQKISTIKNLLRQGKAPAAIKTAKAMIAKDKRDFIAHYYLGKAYILDQKPELALMEFKIVSQNVVFETSSIRENEFRKESAQLFSQFNQIDEALNEYILLTKLEPTNAENFYLAGTLFETKNKSDHAIRFYQKAILLNRKHVKAHAARGMMLYKAKQYPEAKKAIKHALELSPNTFSTYYYLGKILKEEKDYAGAVNAFEKAARDSEFRQKSIIERGTCFMAANNIEKAKAEFERAVNITKNETNETLYAHYFLAACYEQQRKIDLALVQWNMIQKKNPNFRDVPAKLNEYRDLNDNDAMKEYLTCSDAQFAEICKDLAQKAMGLSPKESSITKMGFEILATEDKDANWMNVRKQLFLLIFYREPNPLEDTVVRAVLEKMKKRSCTRGFILTSSGFTRTAVSFAENRLLELIDKEKLQSLLDKAGI